MGVTAPAAAPPASGQGSPAPASQPPAGGGQGQGGGQSTTQSDGFNWGLFPDVPEGQRELLRPHLTNVLGHVTRLEQQYSPYKGLMDAVPGDQVQNLLTFLQNYSTDPRATWLGLAQSLMEDGVITNPDFNVESISQMLDAPQAPPPADMPEWAQQMMGTVQELQSANQQREQQAQAMAAQEEARQQEAMLAEAHSTMMASLKQAGVPEGLVTPEQLTAALIAHQGDMDRAVASFTGLRDGFLKGFTQVNGNGPAKPTVNGVPQAPKGGLRAKGGDGFRDASIGAQQFLAQNAAAAGQE